MVQVCKLRWRRKTFPFLLPAPHFLFPIFRSRFLFLVSHFPSLTACFSIFILTPCCSFHNTHTHSSFPVSPPASHFSFSLHVSRFSPIISQYSHSLLVSHFPPPASHFSFVSHTPVSRAYLVSLPVGTSTVGVPSGHSANLSTTFKTEILP